MTTHWQTWQQSFAEIWIKRGQIGPPPARDIDEPNGLPFVSTVTA
jgi:hypothetical protein